jgi:hypothetical protein
MNTGSAQFATLALVASNYVLKAASHEGRLDSRDKPDHDGNVVFMGSGLIAAQCPGMTARFRFSHSFP